MRAEQQIRTQLGPADPAREVPVPPPAVPATYLIARAAAEETAPVRRRVRPRRLVLAGATAAVVAVVAAYASVQPGGDRGPGSPAGGVVVPIAYEIADDPPPAADYLRDLAALITDAPYEGQPGAYPYHRARTWGGVQVHSEEGHTASYVTETESWVQADGSIRTRDTTVDVEFSSEDARRSWDEEYGFANAYGAIHVQIVPLGLSTIEERYVVPGEPIPADPEQRVTEMVGVDPEGGTYFDAIREVYRSYLVPRDHRAAILEALAEVPGVMWRGEVVDRAGRLGVAVTYDRVHGGEADLQWVLVFDPQTGELLATELILLGDSAEHRLVNYYLLLLEAGWTDDPGPEPTYPSNSPSPEPVS